MKRFLVWLCTVAMLMSSIMLTQIAYAADTPTATATDVYISGNWVVGETLTAEYTYYDTAGTTENTANTTFQWYHIGSSTTNDTAISGATGKTYTLQASDAGKSIYFVVTPNGAGKGRKVSSAGYGTVQTVNSTATAPTALNATLTLTDGYNKVMPGSKMKVHYAAAFFNDEEEGATKFQWYTSDASNKTAPTVIEGATAQTYTITEAEYGKYLYAEVVVKDESGDIATAISTDAIFVGNQLPINGVNTSSYNMFRAEYAGVSAILSGFGGKNEFATYSNQTSYVIVDAEEPVKVDGFKFSVYSSTAIEIAYSDDNATWTSITQDKDGNALSTYAGTSSRLVQKDIRLAEVITARYFKFTYTHTDSGTIYRFYPYLSKDNRAFELIDITSADNGIEFDNTANTVTSITYGMPAVVLKNSIHVMEGSTVSIANASGADIADLSGIKITDTTCADYRVKIARGNATHLFTLACAPAYKTDDFSTMTDSKKYWGSTWGTRNFARTEDVQWYGSGSDADISPYAIKDVTDGVTSAKIVKNGTTGGNTCAVWYGAATNPTDKISFSFDVKIDDFSSISLAGKIDDRNGRNTFGSKMSVGSGGIVAAGTDGLKKMVNIKPDEWYRVEVITDLENDTHTILVDGVVYAENVPFTYAQENPAKTSIFFNLLFSVTEGGENDINYLKNVQFRKVYSVSDYVSTAGEEVGMTLYDGANIVTALTPDKTYTVKNNGKIFTDNFYVAVYKVNYADDAAHTVNDCVLVDAKQIKGSAVATGSIYIPADIKSTYESGNIKTGAMVKVFYFNDMITPVKKPDVIR